jgi:hypothetical protein
VRRVLLAIVLIVLAACGASSSEPPPVPSGSLGTMDLPPAKPAPSATQAKKPAPPPRPQDQEPDESLAVPGPLALPCTEDTQCGLHRCNKQYGKCTFPCQGDADCRANDQCMSGLCVPRPRP